MSTIPGVDVMYGGISIRATMAGGNRAVVEYTQEGNIQVTLNDNSAVFDQNEVGPLWTVNYSGDQKQQGGGDSFTNHTNLTSSVAMYGGYNSVQGGSGWDFVMVTQDNNYVDTGYGGGMVYSFAGRNDQIRSADEVYVYTYDWDPYYYARYY